MNAETIHCPTCGAAISSDSTQCAYCHTKLATVACPKCFGIAFVGSKFCPHCGAELETADSTAAPLNCPRCDVAMTQKSLHNARLMECGRCAGVWVDKATFDRICNDAQE